MGIVIEKQVNTHCKLGVWHITETYEELLSRLKLDQQDYQTMRAFLNPKRKLEWLSVRVLLYKLTQKHNKILYNVNNRPYLADASHHISISHSDEYSAILLCRNQHVGIDIEKMQPKIEHIAFKFLKEQEINQIIPAHGIYHLYLHWCAKEALYKLCDTQGMSMKQHITIEPFYPHKEGKMYGSIQYPFTEQRHQLNYFLIDNYPVVWCLK